MSKTILELALLEESEKSRGYLYVGVEQDLINPKKDKKVKLDTLEEVSNKVNNLDTPNSRTYPTTEAVGNALAGDTNRIPRFTGARQLGNSLLFDNGTNVGVGALSNGARFEVRGQGALSTDIVFRVRNSANTRNFLQVNGVGDVWNNGAGGVNSNTFFGENVGRNATGSFNTAIGQSALFSLSTGIYNTAIGYVALSLNSTGSFNTAIGQNSLENNTTGGSNTAIGQSAGRRISDGSNQTITNQSVFIGFDTRALANNQTNQIVIGNNAIGLGSNTVVLGNDSIATTQLRGNVISGNQAALATNATNGFLYLPTCAGVPTGTPTAITGKVPIVVDSTNNRAYIYSGGAWVALN